MILKTLKTIAIITATPRGYIIVEWIGLITGKLGGALITRTLNL